MQLKNSLHVVQQGFHESLEFDCPGAHLDAQREPGMLFKIEVMTGPDELVWRARIIGESLLMLADLDFLHLTSRGQMLRLGEPKAGPGSGRSSCKSSLLVLDSPYPLHTLSRADTTVWRQSLVPD